MHHDLGAGSALGWYRTPWHCAPPSTTPPGTAPCSPPHRLAQTEGRDSVFWGLGGGLRLHLIFGGGCTLLKGLCGLGDLLSPSALPRSLP